MHLAAQHTKKLTRSILFQTHKYIIIIKEKSNKKINKNRPGKKREC